MDKEEFEELISKVANKHENVSFARLDEGIYRIFGKALTSNPSTAANWSMSCEISINETINMSEEDVLLRLNGLVGDIT